MTCAFCGRQLQKHEGVLPQEAPIILCNQCGTQVLYRCSSCEYKLNCAFEHYDGPEPKFVTKQIRQGNMVAQTQVPNEELLKKLCLECSCGDYKKCFRGDGCDKYTIVEFVVNRQKDQMEKEEV